MDYPSTHGGGQKRLLRIILFVVVDQFGFQSFCFQAVFMTVRFSFAQDFMLQMNLV